MEREEITAAQSHLIVKLLLADLVRRIQDEGPYPIGAMIQLRKSGDGVAAVIITPEATMLQVEEWLEWSEAPATQRPFPASFFTESGQQIPGDIEDRLGAAL